MTVNMECERLLSWFISVAPTVRFFLPTSSTLRISGTLFTTKLVRSRTYTPLSGVSFSSSRVLGVFASRSRISSL